MRFEDILKLAKSNDLDVTTMCEYFNENPKELKRNNRFVDIHRLFSYFKDNKRNDLKDKLLELLKDNKIFYNIFAFMFGDDKTFETLDKILSKTYVLSVEGFNILIESLLEYYNEREIYDEIFSEYYEQVLVSDKKYFLDNVEFSYINGRDMDELLRDHPVYFTKELTKYLKNNPDKNVYFDNYFEKLFNDFFEYASRIFCGKLALSDIKILNTILKEKCNYKRGFRYSSDVYKMIWGYYEETKDSSISIRALQFVKDNLHSCLTIDFNKEKPEEMVIPTKFFKYIGDIVKRADACNARTKFVISYNDANNYYNDLVRLENKDRIIIDFEGIGNDGKMSLKDYIRSHLFYDATIELINRFDFSPFEQYIYAYYLTTILKKYRFYKDDKKLDSIHNNMSRNLYYIIYGDYIVCAGYVNYIVNLLTKLGLKSSFLLVNPPEVQDLHARVLTHIVDSKYGIDGVYIGDPTHDSGLDMCFANAFMTKDKESYDKYQKGNDSAFDFYSAMSSLELNDAQCDARNKQFYDTVDVPISNDVKIKAIKTVFEAIHPDFSPEEVDYYMHDIAEKSNLLYLTDDLLETKCKDSNSFRIVNEAIDSKKIRLKWCTSNTDDRDFFEISFMIKIIGMSDDEVMNKLMLYLDKDITVEYSEYYHSPIIKFNLSADVTIGELLNKMKTYIKSLEVNLNLVEKNNEITKVTYNSLFELFLKNGKVARAILNTGDSTKERNILEMYVNGLINVYEIAALMKFNAIDRNIFISMCEEANISLNNATFMQDKSPSK